MVRRLGAKRWKRLHRLAYPSPIGGGRPLLPAGQVRRAAAARVRRRRRRSCCCIALVAHYVGLRAEAARRAAEDRPARRLRRGRSRTFWSGELTIARIFDETHDVQDVPARAGRRRPAAVHARRRPVPQPGADDRRQARQSLVHDRLVADAQRATARSRSSATPTAMPRSTCTRPGAKASACRCRRRPAGSSSPAHGAERVVLIAGGIGITPMMSIVRSLTDRGWPGRDLPAVLRAGRPRHRLSRRARVPRRHGFPTCTCGSSSRRIPATAWDGPRGQITRDVIADFVPGLTARSRPALRAGADDDRDARRSSSAWAFPMRRSCRRRSCRRRRPSEAAGDRPSPQYDRHAGGWRRRRISSSSARAQPPSVPCDQTVLEAAEDAGVEIPFECRSGICGQCKTPLLSGRVRMDVQDALTTVDRAKGLILACQARPLQSLEVDA